MDEDMRPSGRRYPTREGCAQITPGRDGRARRCRRDCVKHDSSRAGQTPAAGTEPLEENKWSSLLSIPAAPRW
jgi:hypothetical protein